jgi:hypothetical protein
MGKLILGLIAGLVIGGIGATILGSGVAGGAMGVGVATGLSAGICSVVEAAEQSGLLTPEEIGEILTRAAQNMQSLSGETLSGAADAAGTVEDCRGFMENLRAGR